MNYQVHTDHHYVTATIDKTWLYNVHPIVWIWFVAPQPKPLHKCTGVNLGPILEREEGCQGHPHPKLPVSLGCTQQLLSTKDGCTPVGCP